MAHSSSTPQFAILAQRKIKHRTEIVAARRHNNREKVVGNAIPDGPPPVTIVGPSDTWQGVRDRLAELEIKPRKDAVLALELVMTTSPEWWAGRPKDRADAQLKAFERMAMRYLRDRFVSEAIVSATWHLDEQTPHLHVIVVPVRKRVDERFADRRERWGLCARGDLIPAMEAVDRPVWYAAAWRGGVGGRGHMAYEQTRFAEVMAPLKLARGKTWSGAPNKPNSVHQQEMREAIAAAGVERVELARERVDVAMRIGGLTLAEEEAAEAAAALARDRQALADERAAWDQARAAEETRLAGERMRIADAQAELDERSEKAAEFKLAAEKHRAWLGAERARVEDAKAVARQYAELVGDLADAAVRAIAATDLSSLPASRADAVMCAASALQLDLTAASPASWRIAAVAGSRTAWTPAQAGRAL